MNRIHHYLLSVKTNKFLLASIISGVLLNMTITLIFISLFNETFADKNVVTYTVENISLESLFGGILISPFFETLFIQYLIIVVFGRNLDRKYLTFLFILSAGLFAILHGFMSIAYGLAAFFMGLYLSYITILSDFLRREKISTIISVFMVHASINASILIPRYFISLF